MPRKSLTKARTSPRATPALRAGVAKSDITTRERGVAVGDRLFAKALVLDDGEKKIVLITMDAVAIGGICDIRDSFLPKLRRRLRRELGIDERHILVNASHTHPPGRLLCNDAEQVERTFDAVRRASQKMIPVKTGSGTGREDRIMMNRRLRLKNGACWTIRHGNPCPPEEDIAGLGPVDPEIGILRIDRMDGRPFAVVYNFACHPYLGVPQGGVTADFPGFASKVIEESLGHGAMALFLQGAAGDITDILYKEVNRPRDCEPLGTMLGLSTLKALRKIRTRDANISVLSETLKLPRKMDAPARIASLLKEQAALLASLRFTSMNLKTFLPLYIKYALHPDYPLDYSYRYLHAAKRRSAEFTVANEKNRRHMDKYLRNIRAMEKLAKIQDNIATLQKHYDFNRKSGESTIRTEIMGIRIGNFHLITSPAEVFAEVGLNIKKASPHRHTFLAAFSNGYIHYGPTVADYKRGGYEITECLLAPGWQRLFEKKSREILRRL